ncbi:acyl-CoA dehydrogenase NM domain-like protein [Auriscalpium vulgare]|uniref:Acyl-CoA dehydrogenase NM domain-like protein n=1 Tax=Auriscalpium vulgare TaxID=40419 RepID=A0ACB8SAC2_9AGAM|nr:acyl-CoA dehydrogenase NM domain-like protein [Auriscalpium vulgare]
MLPTDNLRAEPLFNALKYRLSAEERAKASYERAKAIAQSYGLTADDACSLTTKFWDIHRDPLMVYDGAAATLLTIQYNLAVGTLSPHLRVRPDLSPLVDDLLSYRKYGVFLLTERGHGLDVANLETTASLTSSGDFVLHTPGPHAAKMMPATIPAGAPCVGIVMARLIIDGADRGVRPFVVDINDGVRMCPGVTARRLPYREGTNPVNHALTSFDNVPLPSTALLGTIDKPESIREGFMWRVAVGGLALSLIGLTALELYCAIGAQYSVRRTVTHSGGVIRPIIYFRTQQVPILTAVAQAHVLRAFHDWAIASFMDAEVDLRVRHGIAVCSKAISIQHSQTAALAISERCGAMGLFAMNQMSQLFDEIRGLAVAEGDVLGVSIRLATELLIQRYQLPGSKNPDSLLARHEAGLFAEHRARLVQISGHRSVAFNNQMLPHCLPLVEAIGHRMAYDAAIASGVAPSLVDLYVASIVKLDPSWYVEHGGLGREAQAAMANTALDAVLPNLEELVRQMPSPPHVTAPIISDSSWDALVDGLDEFQSA